MNSRNRKIAVGILVILLLSLGMQTVVHHALESDENVAKMTSWLSDQREVIALVGRDFTLHVRSRISLEAIPDSPAYSSYSIVLMGNKREVLVVVVVSQGRGQFRIDSIKPL